MSNAIVRHAGSSVPDQHEWKHIERMAAMLAKSSMCPKAFKAKPEDLMVVALSLRDSDVPFTLNTLNQCYVIDGRMEMMAQLKVAVARRNGWDVWFEPFDEHGQPTGEVDDKHAIVHYQGPGKPERTMEYAIAEARSAHLLDEWVELQTPDGSWPDGNPKYRKTKFTVAVDGVPVDEKDMPEWAKTAKQAGPAQRKEPWFAHRESMLMARSATKALRYAAPHLTLGIGDAEFDVIDAESEVSTFDPVAVLQPHLEQLTPEQKAGLGEWRKGEDLPPPSEMDLGQVVAVAVKIGSLLAAPKPEPEVVTPEVVAPQMFDDPERPFTDE